MRTVYLIFFLCLSLKSNSLQAQFQTPKIMYDSVDVIRNEKEIIQKRFFKKSGVVLEINYPDHEKGLIQGECYRSNIVNDSVYIYYGKQRRVITFRSDVIFTSAWEEGTRLIRYESYYPTGQRWTTYTQIAIVDPMRPETPCTFEHFSVGEYVEYDKDGKIIAHKDYNTGKQSVPSKEPPAEVAKLYELKKIADAIVSKSFGKTFFQKNIAINFDKSGYHRAGERYDRGAPSHSSATNWFFYPDKEIQYVDFVYTIKLSPADYYPTIIIRLDRTGNVVKDIVEMYGEKTNSTVGLVVRPMGKILAKEAALTLAAKEGLAKNELPVVDFIWKPDQTGGSEGSYHYRLLFDKLSRQGPGYENIYFREWTINATTKQLSKDGEYVTGEATVEEPGINKDQQNGKYGFANRFENKILIPYDYDELPYNYDAFMIARKDGKVGAITFENEVRVPFIFERVYFISAGKLRRYEDRYLVVETEKAKGLYDAEGHELFPAMFTRIEKGDNEQIVGYKADKVTAILDLRTNTVTMH